MDALLEHLRVYRPGAGRDDFLFLNAQDGNLLRSGFVRDVLGKSAKRAGFAGRRVTWLTLRHTAASLMRERYKEGREKMEDYMKAMRFRSEQDDGQLRSSA